MERNKAKQNLKKGDKVGKSRYAVADRCYYCGKRATGREHVPPLCFFPEGHRRNLLTVPSCKEHNLKKSKDDEYVRNVICAHWQNNKFGESLVIEKAYRSFLRSPSLAKATFQKVYAVMIDGQESGAIILDMERFDNVMTSIGRGIFLHDFHHRYVGSMSVFADSLFTENNFVGIKDSHDETRAIIRRIQFKARNTSNPEVFQYAFAEYLEKFMYCFIFYEGFRVYVLGSHTRPAA